MGVLVASEGLCWWVVWDCTKGPLCGQKTRFVGCGGIIEVSTIKIWRPGPAEGIFFPPFFFLFYFIIFFSPPPIHRNQEHHCY